MLVFIRHPLPWQYKHDYSECGNGGSINAILDANGDVVATDYGNYSGFHALWEFYLALTPEQEIVLGAGYNENLSVQELLDQYASLIGSYGRDSKECKQFLSLYSTNKSFQDVLRTVFSEN